MSTFREENVTLHATLSCSAQSLEHRWSKVTDGLRRQAEANFCLAIDYAKDWRLNSYSTDIDGSGLGVYRRSLGRQDWRNRRVQEYQKKQMNLKYSYPTNFRSESQPVNMARTETSRDHNIYSPQRLLCGLVCLQA